MVYCAWSKSRLRSRKTRRGRPAIRRSLTHLQVVWEFYKFNTICNLFWKLFILATRLFTAYISPMVVFSDVGTARSGFFRNYRLCQIAIPIHYSVVWVRVFPRAVCWSGSQVTRISFPLRALIWRYAGKPGPRGHPARTRSYRKRN